MVFDQPLGDDVAGGFGAMVGREGRGRVRWAASVGYDSRSIEVALAGDDVVRMHSLPLRGGALLALDGRARFAVGASGLVTPILTRGGAGDRGVLLGGGAVVRAAFPLPSAATDVLVAVGVDVMANQIEYRWGGDAVLVTGRVRPWLAIGVSWEDGR
jgi:hypothetical protein